MSKIVTPLLLIAFVVTSARSQPQLNPSNGRFYERVGGTTGFAAAQSAAANRPHPWAARQFFSGAKGRLAVVTHPSINQFILQRSLATFDEWIGGVRTGGGPSDWKWLSNEPFGASPFGAGFTYWGPGEPNNPSETALHYWNGSGNWSSLFWNDAGSTHPATGYIVEYYHVPDIKQFDSSWNTWGMGGSSQTIGKIGCVLTSHCILLNYWGVQVNPVQLDLVLRQEPIAYDKSAESGDHVLIGHAAFHRMMRFAQQNGVALMFYSSSPQGEMTFSQSVTQGLQIGRPVILRVRGVNSGAPNGHSVVGYQQESINAVNTYLIRDPGTGSRLKLNHAGYANRFTKWTIAIPSLGFTAMSPGLSASLSSDAGSIVIIDSQGRRTGRLGDGTVLSEIGNANFSVEGGVENIETGELQSWLPGVLLNNADSGYTMVTSGASGRLRVDASDIAGSFSTQEMNIQATPTLVDVALDRHNAQGFRIAPIVHPSAAVLHSGTASLEPLSKLGIQDADSLSVAPSRLNGSVDLELSGEAPVQNIDEAKFKVVTSFSQTGGYEQVIKLYNFQTSQWETLDVRPTSGQLIATYIELPSPARYIQSGTRAVRAKVILQTTGPRKFNSVFLVDQAVWLFK